jgi:RNA polymerase sigma-70 factor (ECF subfamily)
MQCAIEAVKLEGLSIAEAAQRYRLSEPMVKISIHRGLKALADMIAKEVKA